MMLSDRPCGLDWRLPADCITLSSKWFKFQTRQKTSDKYRKQYYNQYETKIDPAIKYTHSVSFDISPPPCHRSNSMMGMAWKCYNMLWWKYFTSVPLRFDWPDGSKPRSFETRSTVTRCVIWRSLAGHDSFAFHLSWFVGRVGRIFYSRVSGDHPWGLRPEQESCQDNHHYYSIECSSTRSSRPQPLSPTITHNALYHHYHRLWLWRNDREWVENRSEIPLSASKLLRGFVVCSVPFSDRVVAKWG